MFGGNEEDEEEFKVFLRQIKGLRISTFEERQCIFSVLFLKFSFDSCNGVAGFKCTTAGSVGSPDCTRSWVGSQDPRKEWEEVGE